MTWFATGNNVTIVADTARRICHICLETKLENPEFREDFHHDDLEAYVLENRPKLLAAALTILRGYCVAGRPDQRLSAWGSFHKWSALVRSAIVWTGPPDPGEGRQQLRKQADVNAEALAIILPCWKQLDPEGKGLTASHVMDLLYDNRPVPEPPLHHELRAALEAIKRKPDSTWLGMSFLRKYRGKRVSGSYFDRAGTHKNANLWVVKSDLDPAADGKFPTLPNPNAPPPNGGEEIVKTPYD
jgi:hypothetical protein